MFMDIYKFTTDKYCYQKFNFTLKITTNYSKGHLSGCKKNEEKINKNSIS